MKTILVIGGSKGIGASIANRLKDTNHVITISRSLNDVDNITHHSLNVLEDEFPKIDNLDGLVYCPGSINLKSLSRLKIEDFQTDFNINVLGAIRAIKHYEKQLIQSKGSVVLFSTVATHLGMPFHSSIAVSKAAVEGLAKSLAAEYATKIRFNVIAPTVTDTPLASRLLRNEKQQETMRERHPLKQYLDPKEVASLAEYLLSDNTKSISGQIIPMDAGIVSIKL
ncbi:NAD(P)-dependent dehydrogenase, short-chain alcohol dehydrogenase family [Tenacibaculum sp. MAR_2009_124]|uniref:SDR family NAD(P)-dependent oxidoreductase n=1 Tax=Tenacibaculum sp. MAR_2009_124 TaxID=1250059 RepID=UPI000897DF9F|nr:SDR family oxidoreductase [Tenacibaculum sp. MAR_2009_124]SEB44225.1 NAD(P)-dependent dehydrogenase, short-chain alcohol dehydrogenase family [Tenacibaculum sp. MAR_2009_124]